jgi:hypothetical protein
MTDQQATRRAHTHPPENELPLAIAAGERMAA